MSGGDLIDTCRRVCNSEAWCAVITLPKWLLMQTGHQPAPICTSRQEQAGSVASKMTGTSSARCSIAPLLYLSRFLRGIRR